MVPTVKMTAHKAWVAAVLAALASFVAAIQNSDVDAMGWADWLIVVGSAVVAGGAVYAVPNQVKVEDDDGGV